MGRTQSSGCSMNIPETYLPSGPIKNISTNPEVHPETKDYGKHGRDEKNRLLGYLPLFPAVGTPTRGAYHLNGCESGLRRLTTGNSYTEYYSIDSPRKNNVRGKRSSRQHYKQECWGKLYYIHRCKWVRNKSVRQ